MPCRRPYDFERARSQPPGPEISLDAVDDAGEVAVEAAGVVPVGAPLPAGLVDPTLVDESANPDDVADAVAFMASPHSRWVTGQFLDATGGSLLLGP